MLKEIQNNKLLFSYMNDQMDSNRLFLTLKTIAFFSQLFRKVEQWKALK